MADELGTGLKAFGMGDDAMFRRMGASYDKLGAETDDLQSQFKAKGPEIERLMRERQAKTGPAMQKVVDTNKQSPELGELAQPPDAPKKPSFDPKETHETISLLVGIAAMAGALTRQPLTAALNNFTAGVHGLVQGKEQVFQNSLKEFDANLKKAKEQNDVTWNKYQAAQAKHGADVKGAQLEYNMIAAESQNPIEIAMAQRGDITSLIKFNEQKQEKVLQLMNNAQRMRQAAQNHADSMANAKATREATAAYREAQLGQSQQRLDMQADALKAKASSQGGKPTATERQHYVDSNQLLKSVDRISSMLKSPDLRKKIDESQLSGVLSDTIESKLIQQYLVRPNIDPEVKKYLQEIAVLRNQYYLDQSGKAVTGGEALRNYGAVVQPGDSSDDVLNKMTIAKERANEKMKDYETYFPSLKVIRGDQKSDAKSFSSEAEAEAAGVKPGMKVIINGVPGTWH